MNNSNETPVYKPGAAPHEMYIKVIGVGGAGTNALDRLVLDGAVQVDLLACNTDVQALASSVASHKIQLGRRITRGLGAGGDPEVGFNAAEEAGTELREALENVPLVMVCAGLGGGTGSGAVPLIVKLAREQGSLVIVCATLPFSFEGKRRGRQAQEALAAIQQYADAVVCFENDRMGELISSPDSGINEAFAGADKIIGQCVRAVVELVNRRGLIHLGFDDLLSALRNHDARCLFGYGEAGGSDRGRAALAQALQSPLMEAGALLGQASNVLVNIVGGSDLRLAEVQAMMESLADHIGDQTQLLFGAVVDPKLDGRIGVTLISSLGARGNLPAAAPAAPFPQPQPPAPHPQPAPVPTPSYQRPGSAPAPNRPPVAPPAPAPAPAAPAEPAIRGRFEHDKVEPTIVEGEDLDVPTFLRKNFRLK